MICDKAVMCGRALSLLFSTGNQYLIVRIKCYIILQFGLFFPIVVKYMENMPKIKMHKMIYNLNIGQSTEKLHAEYNQYKLA